MFGPELKRKPPSELDKIIKESSKDEEQFWAELFALAEQKNTLLILAGGNENLLIGLDPMQRSPSTLKVVALDQKFKKASFSNYCKDCFGSPSFISAPGVAIYSAVPGNAYMPMDGTSMAAPIATGAIALMKSVNPRLKNKDILKVLYETAKPSSDRTIPPLLQIDKALLKIKL
jgi:subtilisin family serine protease